MQEIFDQYKKTKNLYHAYFLVGDAVEIFSKLQNFLEKEVGIKTSGNPDFWSGSFDNFTIDHARGISESSERKDFEGNKKIFIIQTNTINHEAQNSLLKVFEEPTIGTHFFIISPQDILLPTLRSRMQVVFTGGVEENFDSILKLNLKERLDQVKEITDGISDEEKTKQDAINFLNQIESELYKKGVEKSHGSLKVCELSRKSLYDRGAPVKMILENLVLSI